MRQVNLRWNILAALALGLGLRWWFLSHNAAVTDDALLYGDIAQNLLKHNGYGLTTAVNNLAQVHPTLSRLPGYPLFLALCFAVFGNASYHAVLWVQVVIDLWTSLLLAATARRIAGDQVGMAALWLGAACPFLASYCATPLTEVATLWTIALAFFGVVRWRQAGGGVNAWLGLVGFALGYSILLRPDQGLLAAAVVPGLIWFEADRLHLVYRDFKGWLKAGVFTAGILVSVLTLVPLAPWTLRNWRTFHVFEPLVPKDALDAGKTAPSDFQRWYRTWAVEYASTEEVYWKYDGDTIAIGDLPARAFDSRAQFLETEALLDLV